MDAIEKATLNARDKRKLQQTIDAKQAHKDLKVQRGEKSKQAVTDKLKWLIIMEVTQLASHLKYVEMNGCTLNLEEVC